MKNWTFLILLTFSITILAQDQSYTKISFTKESNQGLKELSPLFKNIKVVAMGESTHGTSEFTILRFKMFKYLVENHQFNTFFLEADYANCLRINNLSLIEVFIKKTSNYSAAPHLRPISQPSIQMYS